MAAYEHDLTPILAAGSAAQMSGRNLSVVLSTYCAELTVSDGCYAYVMLYAHHAHILSVVIMKHCTSS